MQRLKQLLGLAWIGRHKQALGVIIIVLSLGFLAWYGFAHPQIFRSLAHTNPLMMLLILVFYAGTIGIIFLINFFTVRICRKSLGVKEGILLTIYSTVANFFGPLQSGPGVRAVYLKAKIGLRIRDYTMATLFYYAAFGAINASLLFVSTWWILTILGITASVVLIVAGTHYLHFADRAKDVFAIYLVTLLQVCLMIAIYYTELHATGTHASLLQTIVYTASANLSLFVSLTPGGIGIRESFIVFASSLHHLPLASIVAAGVLDRALYVVFLAILFVVSSSLHVKDMIVRKKSA